ncbi:MULTISPECIES: hypothetical protein [unclassified Pseudomonas]|uniref:hypothetical protein n=1 Tax=unclassified Pseudomonas TaxID=196821 RepID=UPI0015A96464|nr:MULTISPECIES: hypothetical protein [unclassified Pseudomonas]
MACLLPFSLRMLKLANRAAMLLASERLVFANLKAPLLIGTSPILACILVIM